MKSDRLTGFSVILGHFFPFYPTNPKNLSFEKMKKTLEISSFYTSVPKIMIICYTLPEKWCVTDETVIFILDYTVKPVYNNHLQDKVSVVVIDRWSL